MRPEGTGSHIVGVIVAVGVAPCHLAAVVRADWDMSSESSLSGRRTGEVTRYQEWDLDVGPAGSPRHNLLNVLESCVQLCPPLGSV